MNHRPFALASLAASLVLEDITLLSPAHAEETAAPTGTWEPGVAITNDRVRRGISQTREDPAVIGEIKWTDPFGVMLGIWGSNLNYGRRSDARAEVDLFAGYTHSFDNSELEAAILRQYAPARTGNIEFTEYKLAVGRAMGIVAVNIGAFYSPKYYIGGQSFYPYIDGRIRLAAVQGVELSLRAHFGASRFSGHQFDNYDDGAIGFSAHRHKVYLSALYSRSNLTPLSTLYNSDLATRQFTVTITRMF